MVIFINPGLKQLLFPQVNRRICCKSLFKNYNSSNSRFRIL